MWRLFSRKPKQEKRYTLWITKYDGLGYSSWCYGWSRDLTFTHKEALKKQAELKKIYYNVEITEVY